ncbi:uncharacterized protein [Typha latifolia]|uniref:uncharacterized protein isoform X1 n=1 Tax=Typha latifolia TaxID=4733 RepID=UPI003C2DC7CA
MVHKRIPMEPRETHALRKRTFKKRQGVLRKRAEELAVLCDADVAILLFSPVGIPSLFLGQNSELATMLDNFSKVDPAERESRKMEVIKKLSKSMKKEDHEIAPELLAPEGHQEIEEYKAYLRDIQEKIDESNENLRFWNNPDAIDNILEITEMENILRESLVKIQNQKAQILELASPIASEASSSASPISTNNDELPEFSFGELLDIIFTPTRSLDEVTEEMVSVSDLYPYSTVTSNTISQTWEVSSYNPPIAAAANNEQLADISFTELLADSLDELSVETISGPYSYLYSTDCTVHYNTISELLNDPLDELSVQTTFGPDSYPYSTDSTVHYNTISELLNDPLDELSVEAISGLDSYPYSTDRTIHYNTISEIREAWNSWGGPLLEETWWDKVYNYDLPKESM